MPAPRSNEAPYFSGQPGDQLADFLHEYDSLASSLGLTSAQKVEAIFRYVSANTREFWMTLGSYASKDWKALRSELEDLYPDTAASKRYTKAALKTFIKISARTRIQDEDDLILYHRRFLQISNPLRRSQSLSDEERNAEFFNGFHPKDRDILYDRLYILNPRRPINKAPNFDETWEAARGYFTHNQFHLRTMRDPQRYGQDQHKYDQYDQDPYYHHNTPPTQSFHNARFRQDEDHLSLSDIIHRMHDLSVHDVDYAVLYAQCMQRFPVIAQQLAKPDMFQASSMFTFQAPPRPPQPQPAASLAVNAPPVRTQRPSTQQQSFAHTSSNAEEFFHKPHLDICTFCTKSGHTNHGCPNAIVKGGRIHLPNAYTPDTPPAQAPSSRTTRSQFDTMPHMTFSFEATRSEVHTAQLLDIADVPAASSPRGKDLVKQTHTRSTETGTFEQPAPSPKPEYLPPLQETNALVGGGDTEAGIPNEGLQIAATQKDQANEVATRFNFRDKLDSYTNIIVHNLDYSHKDSIPSRKQAPPPENLRIIRHQLEEPPPFPSSYPRTSALDHARS